MQSLYLTEYISSPLFLQELKERNLSYQVILSDISYEESPIPFFLLDHKPSKEHLLQYRNTAIEEYDHILIILSQLPISFIQPLLDKYSWTTEKKITIINLYVGIGSFGRKISPELSEITSFTYDIAKYEPLDLVNFFTILENTSFNKYIRIPHQHFPESIFSVEDVAIVDAQTLWPIEVLSLTGYGYTGSDATIITTGTNFSTILQLGDLLQEQNFNTDIFVLSKITIDLTEEMKSSLHKTKKLIRIMDQLPNQLKSFLSEQLHHLGLKDISIQILSPSYEKLTTIFDEFSSEQAEFNAEGLVNTILP